jgi:hypothetical protein
MNHQPFEDWLLSKEPITPEQETELRQHLHDCPDCTNLAFTWQAVAQELERAPQAAPAPGFGNRWQARLAEKRAQKQRRFTWWVIGLNLSAALGIFLALNLHRLSSLSFSQLLVSALYTFTLILARIDSAEVLFKLFFSEVNPLIPLGIISVIGTSLSVLSLIWIFSMWKIFIPQGARNETHQ